MRAPRITRVSSIVGVWDELTAPRFDHVVVATPGSDLVVRCNPDTDEVVLSRQKKKRRVGLVLARGSFRVLWTWVLTNQQGYTDGFRIELESKGQTRVFDFIAVVSSVEVREAEERRANQSVESNAGLPPPSNGRSPAVSRRQPGVSHA